MDAQRSPLFAFAANRSMRGEIMTRRACIGILIGALTAIGVSAQTNPHSAIGRAIERVGLEHGQRLALMRAIADELNVDAGQPLYGVLVKRTGNNCGGYSCDVICSGQGADQRQWDVLEDETRPAFNEVGQAGMRRDVCEIRAGGGPGPVPQPTPPPQLDRLVQLVEQLGERLRALQERIDLIQQEARERANEQREQINRLPGEIVIPPVTLPPLRCTGNTKPFGGALVLDCDKRP